MVNRRVSQRQGEERQSERNVSSELELCWADIATV
jgi:hypothetical protein